MSAFHTLKTRENCELISANHVGDTDPMDANQDWLVVEPYPSEKYEFVTWDDDIPKSYGKLKVMFQSPPIRRHIHI